MWINDTSTGKISTLMFAIKLTKPWLKYLMVTPRLGEVVIDMTVHQVYVGTWGVWTNKAEINNRTENTFVTIPS